MSKGRSLKVKCPTWDHVETFYSRKLRNGNMLAVRVPFSVEPRGRLDIGLELPNELEMAIAGRVRTVKPASDGQRTAVQLELVGFTDEIRNRLERLVAEARAEDAAPPEQPPAAPAPPPRARTSRPPPAPEPADAPVDEVVTPPKAPSAEEVVPEEREVFDALASELDRLREYAAHEVLGVAWDAGVLELRSAYFDITKRHHPDLFGKYRSGAIKELAQELFIHINKAYDRMRDAAVAAGDAIIAGPALLPHTGWLASFDDIGPEEPRRPRARRRPPPAPPVPDVQFADGGESGQPARPVQEPEAPGVKINKPLTADHLFGDLDLEEERDDEGAGMLEPPPGEVEALEDAARGLSDERDFAGARDKLAEALHLDPRNRRVRARYHVASAHVKLGDGDRVQAISQLESALAHDPECAEARDALEAMKNGGDGKRRGLFRRLFR